MATWLTQDDVANFGGELLDVTQRAAMHAVVPHLQNLEHQNAELRQRLAIEARHRLDQQLAQAVPNFREVDRDPRWLRWLMLPDPLTGQVRQVLLNEAIDQGSASRVIAFFRGFLREAGGVGGQQGQGQAAPGAPQGRVYSRPEIVRMASLRRRGAISDEQWRQWEVELCRASREGRIAGGLSLDGR